jgi:hypothetical protein
LVEDSGSHGVDVVAEGRRSVKKKEKRGQSDVVVEKRKRTAWGTNTWSFQVDGISEVE